MVAWLEFRHSGLLRDFAGCLVDFPILTSATRVQELAVQRIASPAAASLLLGAHVPPQIPEERTIPFSSAPLVKEQACYSSMAPRIRSLSSSTTASCP